MAHQKPICAATVRVGPGWLEVPFYATQEARRNKGHGRALLAAIEDVCRLLHLPRVLLCSTDDARVKATWRQLGFEFTTPADLARFGVSRHDLLHMDNTVQMHREVPPAPPPLRSLVVRHGDFKQRLYLPPGGGAPPPAALARGGRLRVASKPPKKAARVRKR